MNKIIVANLSYSPRPRLRAGLLITSERINEAKFHINSTVTINSTITLMRQPSQEGPQAIF